MKKLLLTLLAATVLTSATAQDAPPFPDIPAGHWAGEAVARITELGIIIGFPDGTFRGNEAFTRYQAALVVDRLIDVLEAEFLTDADAEALRNAIQELASDLAAQDARLSELESVILDDVLPRIEALEAGIGDPEAFADLQNQIDQIRVAADTALARAEAAEELANQAIGEVDALRAQVEANTSAIDALNELALLLNEDVDDLRRQFESLVVPEGDTAFLDDIARNTADIANIREFVILLRRDQVALRDRVSALEVSQEAQDVRIDDLDERVGILERDQLIVSGSLTLQYDVFRFGPTVTNRQFDVDRIFGIGLRTGGDPSFFSTENPDDRDAQERSDFRRSIPGGIDTKLELTIGFSPERLAASALGLQTFEAFLELNLRRVTDPELRGPNPDRDFRDDPDQAITGYIFELSTFTTTLTPIGAEPITFSFGTDVRTEFTPYVLSEIRFDHRQLLELFDGTNADIGQNRDRNDRVEGFVATVGSPDFLAFLDPTLTIAYGTKRNDRIENDYLRAIRGTLSPFEGLTGGFSIAQYSLGADEPSVAPDREATAIGFDGELNLSIFTLTGEYASFAVVDDGATTVAGGTALNAVLDVDAESIPILTSLTANYRTVPDTWVGLTQNNRGNYREDQYPFGRDQTGFGARAGLELFIVDVEAYFDTFSITRLGAGRTAALGEGSVTAFGVEPSVELFAGFSVNGFFRNVTFDGAVVDRLSRTRTAADDLTGNLDVRRRINGADTNYITGFGFGISHDGDSENALIPGLNISAGYELQDAGFRTPRIFAEADYTLDVAFVNLTPYVGFENIAPPDADRYSDTIIRVGTGLSTEPLDIFLGPSLVGNVNYRSTDRSGRTASLAADTPEAYVSTEFQFSVGVALNEFLFGENSTLTARYGSYSGTNVQFDRRPNTGAPDTNRVWTPGEVTFRDDVTVTTAGYEVVWNFFDLELGYGVYTYNAPASNVRDEATGTFPAAVETVGQAFRIVYTINF